MDWLTVSLSVFFIAMVVYMGFITYELVAILRNVRKISQNAAGMSDDLNSVKEGVKSVINLVSNKLVDKVIDGKGGGKKSGK